MMPAALLSDEDVGLAPSPLPSAPSSDSSPIDPASRPLTIRRGSAVPVGATLMSDEDVGLVPPGTVSASADGQGPLSNTQDDGWLSGAAKGFGTAAIKGLSHIPGVFGDVNDLARFLAAGAASATFDSRPASQIYADMKAKEDAYDRTNPLSPTNWAPNSSDVSAPILKKTGEYVPTSAPGRLAQAGAEAAFAGLGPGAGAAAEGALGRSVLAATAKQAPLNALAGAAGQGATDASGNPYLGVAASFAAPAAADGVLAAGKSIAAPMIEANRPARVGQQILDASSDPAALKTSLGLGDPVGQSSVAVPGATPTTGQMTGDYGILAAQRQAETANNIPFLQREADQNSANKAALANLAPASADTMAPSQFIGQHLDAIDQASAAAEQRIIDHAQSLAAPLGLGASPDVNGSAIRGAIENARGQAKQLRNSLYGAVDPDGSLNLVATPASDAAKQIASSVDPLGAPLGNEEARIIGKMQSMPDVVPYKSMIALDQDITAAMSQERRTAGETPTWGRLSQLKGAVLSTINNALDNQHAFEQSAAARGVLAPEDTMASRLGDLWSDQLPGVSDASGTVARVGGSPGQISGSRTSESFGYGGTGRYSARRFGETAGDQGLPEVPIFDPDVVVQKPVRPNVPRPQTLHDFIKANGGVRDPGGDLKSIGLDRVRGLIAPPGKGLSPDAMRRVAAEAGYLGADTANAMRNTDINDLFEAIGSDKHIHSVYDEDAVHAWDRYNEAKREYDYRPDVASRSAMPLKPPISAYRQEDAYPLGMAPSDVPKPVLLPNFDQTAADRLAAAKAAHADYAQTYKNGPVAAAIKTNGFAGQYRLFDSALPSQALVKGDKGGQTIAAFLKAAKNDPAAVSAIQDHALEPLRSSLTPQGTVSPKALDKWKSDYAPALAEIDKTTPGFSSQFDTAAKATDIMTRAGAARLSLLDAAQKSAAAKFLGKTQPVEVENQIGAMLTAPKNGPTQVRSTVQAMAKDSEALAGLRKAAIDWMTRKFVNTAEAGTSGEKSMASAAFQKFLANNRPALLQLFPEAHVNMMGAVVGSLERMNRDLTGTRIKGSPGTAKDLSPLVQKAIGAAHGTAGHTALGMAIFSGLEKAYEHGGLKGAALAAAPIATLAALNHLRSTGLSKEQAMFRDALLNPDRARAYIEAIPSNPKIGPLHMLASSLRREMIAAPGIKDAQQRFKRENPR